MPYSSTIRAFQRTLPSFAFVDPLSFAEGFAQKRYRKKMEEPVKGRSDDLAALAWDSWIDNDASLPAIGRPLSEWYVARDVLHRRLGQYLPDEPSFPQGSEFHPTRGQNSVEARLAASKWTCTIENFEGFSRLCYDHTALKRAVRRRYDRWYRQKDFDITSRESDKVLYRHFKGSGVGFRVFQWKLRQVTEIVGGSRFSTVPKNNEKRRPINIEPFGNILTQRQVGNWIRSQIQKIWGLDLDNLADTQRIRIRDVDGIATIDLKDASDSISMDLCRFLLPGRIMKLLERSRSPMVLGPDDNYYLPKKISSMGNGFTFELMTLILTAVCRALDPQATVFGDDIIIDRSKSDRLMVVLSSVGLKVNYEKSFTEGPFRESCGANFHSEQGYIESYDFEYPETIGDCVLIWNKVVRLAPLYPSFKKLQDSLYRSIPTALRGGPDLHFEQCDMLELKGKWDSLSNEEPAVSFPPYFVTHKVGAGLEPDPKLKARLKEIQWGTSVLIPGFEYKPELRSATLRHLKPNRHWAKYLMYLASGRRSKDVLSGSGTWERVWFVASGGRLIRASALTT